MKAPFMRRLTMGEAPAGTPLNPQCDLLMAERNPFRVP